MSRSLSAKHQHPHHERNAQFWALVTTATFPGALLLFSSVGVSAIPSFFLAMVATLLVLVFNVALEGHIWMFHPMWAEHFERKDFSFRLAVASGALLLVVETAILAYVFFGPGVDRVFLAYLEDRYCGQSSSSTPALCEAFKTAP